MKPSRSGHLPINGLQLYYEVHGELGASEAGPLMLIPGAFMATDSMDQWVAAFEPKRPVLVFDQQGHGRTADTPRTMSYEQFGDDAAALLHAGCVQFGREAFRAKEVDLVAGCQLILVALALALFYPY
jgi:pimeloyl-ACP methyl ester carboxylesterase